MTRSEQAEERERYLTQRMKYDREVLRKFCEKLLTAEDPAYEMSWAADELMTCARLAALLRAQKTGWTAEQFTTEALRMARFPEHSTSPLSNEMHRLVAAAYIEMAEILKDLEGEATR